MGQGFSKRRILTEDQLKRIRATQKFESNLAQRCIIENMMKSEKYSSMVSKLIQDRKESNDDKLQLPKEFYDAYKEISQTISTQLANIPNLANLSYKPNTNTEGHTTRPERTNNNWTKKRREFTKTPRTFHPRKEKRF